MDVRQRHNHHYIYTVTVTDRHDNEHGSPHLGVDKKSCEAELVGLGI